MLELKRIEKEIFDFSSTIVRRSVDILHTQVSKDEKIKLKYYLFELSMQLSYLQNGITEFLYGIDKNIRKINKNLIN